MIGVIAKRELVSVSQDGGKTKISIEIEAPFESQGHFTCQINFIGLFDRRHQIHGDDSMQALCLAIRFANSLLENVVQEGGKFLYPDDGSEVDNEFLLG